MLMHPIHRATCGLFRSLALAIILSAGIACAGARAAPAQNSSPTQVQQFLELLKDPTVRNWIDQQRQPTAALGIVGPPPTTSEMMAARTASLREHIASLVFAAHGLP